LHVEALAHEATSVGDDEPEVGSHEFVHGALGLPATASEGASCAYVSPARAQGSTHAVEERPLKALDAKLGRDAGATPANAIARDLVATARSHQRRGGGPLEQAHEPGDVNRTVGVLGGVAEHRRRKHATVAQLSRQRAKRPR
jgi:hypothetical protein